MFQKTRVALEAITGLSLAVLSACQPDISQTQLEPLEKPQPLTVTQAPIQPSSHAPRTLKFSLSLSSPQDLRVEKGGFIQKGQVIAEQTAAKRELMGRKQQLERLLSLYAQQPSIPVLQPPSIQAEVAQVEAAQQQVNDAITALQAFEAASPWTETAQRVLPLEKQAQQLTLEDRYQTAQRALMMAEGKLRAARETAQVSKAEAIGSVQQTQLLAVVKQTDLVAQLEEINRQLEHEGIVRSPYSGTVRSLKWEEQADQTLKVSLTLAVDQEPVTVPSSPGLVELDTSAEQLGEQSPEQYTQQSGEPLAQQLGGRSIPAKEWSVVSVYDGDTLRVTDGVTTERIRFACIDAPELKQEFGVESRDFLRELIAQNDDRVRLNVVETDRYGRQVAEVFVGNQLVQRLQVEAGMAHVYRKYIANCSYGNELLRVEAIASQARVGLWLSDPVRPWNFRKQS